MFRKKQVVVIASIALVCFLIGTSMASDGSNPFDKIWKAINDLEARTTPRVELLFTHRVEHPYIHYHYGYAFIGQWNTSKIQVEPFNDKLNSTLNGRLLWDAYVREDNPLAPHMKGYEHYVRVVVKEELTEADIEITRLLILEYLM